jgi:hypothetical protein
MNYYKGLKGEPNGYDECQLEGNFEEYNGRQLQLGLNENINGYTFYNKVGVVSFENFNVVVKVEVHGEVVPTDKGYKCNKIFISNPVNTCVFFRNLSEKETEEAIQKNYMCLIFVEKQTPKLCMMSLSGYCFSLQFIKNQTDEMCLKSVRTLSSNLKHVKKQTPEICIAAMERCTLSAYKYVEKQTPEICMAMVKNYPRSLQFVKEQTEEICIVALTKDIFVLKFVRNITPKIRLLFPEEEEEFGLFD